MPDFPDKRHDQLVLCAEVGEGIIANPGDFPNPPSPLLFLDLVSALVYHASAVFMTKRKGAGWPLPPR